MAAKFEVVNKYKNADLTMPVRKTANSAGYDLAVAEDTVIYPYMTFVEILCGLNENHLINCDPITLDEMSNITKAYQARPTLVSTGMKCKLNPNTYLELSVRSSSPLKYWIVLANGVGIIDADYYNNADNEGEIFFQLINLSPYPIKLNKGDIIGQGIIKSYLITEDDQAAGVREGGFGSTTKNG